jgi:hypothetical protein
MKEEFDLFREHCIWAYECWKMYQIMSEYEIKDPTGIWTRFGTILLEYVFSQIAKINDPDEYRGKKNLSLKYFVTHCVKKDNYKDSYKKFCEVNAEFIAAVKVARNKVTAHSALTVYKSGKAVGDFTMGQDEKYFDSLHEIISEGYNQLGFGPFPDWPHFIEGDAKEFMNKLTKVFGT